MKFDWTMFVFVLAMLVGQAVTEPGNATRTGKREGKVFSLFSIVQFPNEGCTSTSSTYNNGTCYTASECTSNGGSALGNCAAGFGVCCVFSVSATGSTVAQNCSYIVNPSYPANYAPTSTPVTLTYTINKCSTDICRIRLDYETHILSVPLTPQATEGQCSTDVMTIATTGQTTVPSAGVYGFYPWLCGTNTGQHSYIDVSETADDSATISFTLGDTTNNQWKMKVTQYSCNDAGIAAQSGCFQYFTGVTGTVQSYNFANSLQLATQSWKACIRQEVGYCCIQWTVISYNLSPTACDAPANTCAGATNCITEYITIPGGQSSTTGQPITSNSRFCGVNLNVLGYITQNTPIISCTQPFEIGHTSGITAVGGTGVDSAGTGFQLSYTQLPTGC